MRGRRRHVMGRQNMPSAQGAGVRHERRQQRTIRRITMRLPGTSGRTTRRRLAGLIPRPAGAAAQFRQDLGGHDDLHSDGRSPVPLPVHAGTGPAVRVGHGPCRKKPGGAQVVIFTRRIDSQIGVPTGWTLSDALTGHDLPAASGAVPLATDGKSIPTGNGVGSYSRVRMLQPDRRRDDKNAAATPARSR